MVVVAEELQEQLLAREEELTPTGEVLTMWDVKANISEKALVKVSADHDTQRTKNVTRCFS
jgi:hypothetical protein